MLGTVFALLGAFVGVWAFFKYILLIETRLDVNCFKTLYDMCKDEKKILIQEEFITEAKYPVTYIAICFFKGAPWFHLSHQERLLQTGWHGKDYVTTATCFRWRYSSLKKFLLTKIKVEQLERLGIPVEIITPMYTDKIGVLKGMSPEPIVDEACWHDIDREVAEVAEGKRSKTSALLYGTPGNGKTSLVKYLATKYRLPIKIVTFNPDWTNHELLLLFAQIPSKCIVLMEDFDNYFDGRQCIIGTENKSIKFTFDIILNGLDGVYNTYENVVFLMTVNDIKKVDPALRNRPSRFKYVKNFDNPNLVVRQKLLTPHWAQLSEGLNLDQVFRLREYYEELGSDFKTAMQKLEKEVGLEELQKIAFRRFEERLASGEHATPEDDWYHAEHSVNGKSAKGGTRCTF